MMIKKYVLLTSHAFLLLAFVCSPANAQEDGWRFHLAPYLWMSGLNGDVAIKGLPAKVDAGFSDIWRALDMAFLLHAEVRKGTWGVLLDPTYMKLSEEAEAGSTNVKVELTDWLVDIGAFYTLYEKEPSSNGRMIRVDALAGGRYMSLNLTLDVTGIGDGSGSEHWFDPLVGARMMADLTEELRVTLRADIGGFGIGSNLAWNMSSYLGYQFTPTFSLWCGYRALGVDYENGSAPPSAASLSEAKVDRDYFKYDMMMSGPVIGLGFSF